MGLLEVVSGALDALNVKAAPTGAMLQGSGGMGLSSFPISFPGWPDRTGKYTNDYDRARMALTSAWVYSDIMAIGREFSIAALNVNRLQGEDKTAVENHPLELLWNKPNPFMGRSFLEQFWVSQLLLSGEGYIYQAPKGADMGGGQMLVKGVAELWPVPSFLMEPVADKDNFISGYLFKPNGRKEDAITIPTECIIYSQLIHPFDPRRGLSPLAAAFMGIEIDLAEQRWNRSFFGQRNAIPSAIAVVPQHTTNGDFERMKTEIFDFFGGGKREVAVTRAGDLDFKVLSQTMRDMDFVKGRSFNRDEIDRAFGFPAGYWTDSSYANREGAKATLISNVIWPLLVMLAEDINAMAMPALLDDDERVEFEDIRPRNIALDLQQRTTWAQYRTVNELRHEDQLNALEGDSWDTMPAAAALAAASRPLPISAPATDQRGSDSTGESNRTRDDSVAPSDTGTPDDEQNTVTPRGSVQAPEGATASVSLDALKANQLLERIRSMRDAMKTARMTKPPEPPVPPAPVINVQPTPVTVNVEPTPITVNVQPTPVSIEPPQVTVKVQPTPVTVNTPPAQVDVNVKLDEGETVTDVQRDARGFITQTRRRRG